MSDIYIKDEGYMDVRLHRNLKAQKFCHSLGIKNSLAEQFPDGYCGFPVWVPGYKKNDAMFSFVLDRKMHKTFIKQCEAAGLTVSSEFN